MDDPRLLGRIEHFPDRILQLQEFEGRYECDQDEFEQIYARTTAVYLP